MMKPIPIEATVARPKIADGWTFAAFRAWRARELPGSAYQIAAKVWRPESLAEVAGETDGQRRTLKNWEPRFTGMAYSDREVYLVEVVGQLTAERVGKALYGANLFRRDPDYVDHRDKQVHLIILARDATTSLREFAQCYGIRVMVLGDENALEGSDSREYINQSEQKSAAVAEEPLSYRSLMVTIARAAPRRALEWSRRNSERPGAAGKSG